MQAGSSGQSSSNTVPQLVRKLNCGVLPVAENREEAIGHNVSTEAEPAGVVPYRAARTGFSNRMLAERGHGKFRLVMFQDETSVKHLKQLARVA